VLLLFWRSPPATTGVTAVVGRPRTALVATRAARQTVSQRGSFRLTATIARGAGSSLVILSVGRGAPTARRGATVPTAVWGRAAALVATRATELQFASVIADMSDGGWTNELGSNVNLYASLDETVASDADYIRSSLSPLVADEVTLKLGSLNYPLATTDHTLRYRYRKDATGGETINLTVTLYLADGVTVITARTHADIDAVTDAVLTLTEAEAGAIPPSDYAAGLVLGLKAVVA